MCHLLFSLVIAGLVEVSPGVYEVQAVTSDGVLVECRVEPVKK